MFGIVFVSDFVELDNCLANLRPTSCLVYRYGIIFKKKHLISNNAVILMLTKIRLFLMARSLSLIIIKVFNVLALLC